MLREKDYYSQKKKKVSSVLKRQRFKPEEDELLKRLVNESSVAINWKDISLQMKNRTPRQCRERYKNYLKPNMIKKSWTEEEDRLILKKYSEIGAKWVTIAKLLVGRSGNDTRNRYLALVRKRKYKISKRDKPIPKPIDTPIFQQIQQQSVSIPQPPQPIKDPNSGYLISDFEKSIKQTSSSMFPSQINDQDLFYFYNDNI